MPVAAPRADILQAFDVHGYFPHEFTFSEFLLHTRAEPRRLRLGQIVGMHVKIDAELLQNRTRERASDAFDGGQGDFDTLAAGKDDTGDAEHS